MAGEMMELAKTRIGECIKSGDVQQLKNWIACGEDAKFKDRKGNTYIHYVCTMYRPVVFHVLVDAGIDVSAQNRHGNTALHVTAAQEECCHVGDLMACGIDPFRKNTGESLVSSFHLCPVLTGRTASEMNVQNKYWHAIYNRYQPGIFKVIENYDKELVLHLLHCWSKVDAIRGDQNLRQFAAALKHHDIVRILDEHKPTLTAIYGVLEGNHDKVKRAIKKESCDINFTNKASFRPHIIQHAIKQGDLQMVTTLCQAGADVNMMVNVGSYLKGPLYFDILNTAVNPEIMWKILRSGSNFRLNDERGRTAAIFALDKSNGEMPVDIFAYMLDNGAYIADRDNIGVTLRDVARFLRRHDVVALIDNLYVKVIRDSDLTMLRQLAMDGYDGLLIQHNYRDSYIYAAGNESDEILKFLEWLPKFQSQVKVLHKAIKDDPEEDVVTFLDNSVDHHMLIRTKDKGGRTSLMKAVLFNKLKIVQYLISDLTDTDINVRDNSQRTAYHYACAVGSTARMLFKNSNVDEEICDCMGYQAADYEANADLVSWTETEKKATYGMELELICVDKYEELSKIIRSKGKSLMNFQNCIKGFPYPVVQFAKLLQPLMPGFRDLIFLSIDYGKEDIARHLYHLRANCTRKEKYSTHSGGSNVHVFLTPEERARHLKMTDLADFLKDRKSKR